MNKCGDSSSAAPRRVNKIIADTHLVTQPRKPQVSQYIQVSSYLKDLTENYEHSKRPYNDTERRELPGGQRLTFNSKDLYLCPSLSLDCSPGSRNSFAALAPMPSRHLLCLKTVMRNSHLKHGRLMALLLPLPPQNSFNDKWIQMRTKRR